ncbi:hypothetical protein CHARACLAT_024428 [Characodon lateralis]|uniref:Uncharacterized protein n=1 Tax=Characodon lateralis TaxID=208331 RepID=A0ABU7DLH3_9TELE|nr:hypothetical protein [Characodon lateralis]
MGEDRLLYFKGKLTDTVWEFLFQIHLPFIPKSNTDNPAQSSLHQSLVVPPPGGGPTGGWPHVSHSTLACPDPARNNPATRCSPTSPDPRPGSKVGPRLCRTGGHHVPRLYDPHEGVLKVCGACRGSNPRTR